MFGNVDEKCFLTALFYLLLFIGLSQQEKVGGPALTISVKGSCGFGNGELADYGRGINTCGLQKMQMGWVYKEL